VNLLLDSRQLRQFRHIVENGSLSAAARKLRIAQPSLSQLVKNLEDAMGVELLVRNARGVSATAAGQRLYEYAGRIDLLLKEAEEDVVNVGSNPSGRVVFGMPPTISLTLSIPMAETIRLQVPNIHFCATEAMSGHIREWVLSGEVDLAILYDVSGLGECSVEKLLTEDLWFYAAYDDWPFKTKPGKPVTFKSVMNTGLVLPSRRHGLRTFIDSVAKSQHLDPSVSIEMDSLSQIKSLVSRGSGYTILSPSAVHDLVETNMIVGSPITEPTFQREVFLVRSASKRLTAAIHATEQCCREVVNDLIARNIWQATLAPHT